MNTRKPKILVIQGGFPSLSATFILDQMTGLLDRGFEIENWATIAPEDGLEHTAVSKYDLRSRTKYFADFRCKKGDDWASSFLSYMGRDNLDDIDAIHVHYGATFNKLRELFQHTNKFVIVSFHGYDASKYIVTNGADCYTELFVRADLITTPSQEMKDKLVSFGCPATKIMIHRYGVDLDTLISSGGSVRSGTGLLLPGESNPVPPQQNICKLVTVGRLVEKKGIHFAISAIALLPEPKRVHYTIIGAGPLEEKLRYLVGHFGLQNQVTFLGAQDKKRVLEELGSADVSVLTSATGSDGDQEGLPVSIIEAQAMGLPVISSYHAGIPEIVTHAHTGLLSVEGDILGIRNNIQRLIEDPIYRAKLAANARLKVVEEFDIEKQNDRLAAIFNMGIANRSMVFDYCCSMNSQIPKALVVSVQDKSHNALVMLREGKASEALAEARSLVTQCQDNRTAVMNCAQIFEELELSEELFDLLSAYLAFVPCDGQVITYFDNLFYKKEFPHALFNDMMAKSGFGQHQAGERNTGDEGMLSEVLAMKSWSHRYERYAPVFDQVDYHPSWRSSLRPLHQIPAAGGGGGSGVGTGVMGVSVVIVTWKDDPAYYGLLYALRKQAIRKQAMENPAMGKLEIIFVDNGCPEASLERLKPYVDVYVKLNRNTGAYMSRNIGAAFASQNVLLFLEDDGIPDVGLIDGHLNAFAKYCIISSRGVYRFRTQSPANISAHHYFIGDQVCPCAPNLEGNAAFSARPFYEIGGWDDEIFFGHGGYEISLRLLATFPYIGSQIYNPAAVIFHDYAKNEEHLLNKREKQRMSYERLERKYQHWNFFFKNWKVWQNQPDYLFERVSEEGQVG